MHNNKDNPGFQISSYQIGNTIVIEVCKADNESENEEGEFTR